jgi:hypothetical protein
MREVAAGSGQFDATVYEVNSLQARSGSARSRLPPITASRDRDLTTSGLVVGFSLDAYSVVR